MSGLRVVANPRRLSVGCGRANSWSRFDRFQTLLHEHPVLGRALCPGSDKGVLAHLKIIQGPATTGTVTSGAGTSMGYTGTPYSLRLIGKRSPTVATPSLQQ